MSVVTHIFEFLQVHWTWMLLGTLATMVLSGLCFGVACLILVRLPQTYFSEPRQSGCRVRTQAPALHGLMIAIKNICGALILALGMVLAIPGVPGPGILIALLGLMLMDFPAKRRLEWLLVLNTGAFPLINQLRNRRGRAPLAPGTSLKTSAAVG